MTGEEFTTEPDEALLSRLALIDDRPLTDRAQAFRQLHDELRQALEASDRDPDRLA
jgi:hypothetical protein